MTTGGPWTNQKVVERLEHLCRTTIFSNAYMAAILNQEFGLTLTRNAVIGRRARDGLGSPQKARTERIARRQQNGRPYTARRKSVIRLPPTKPSDILPPPPPVIPPHACNLMALNNYTCRYPYGDVGHKGFFFCGAPEADLAERRPYCPSHARIVVNPR